MKAKIKAILCIDVDGTLIDAHERIHPKDAAILQDFPGSIQPVLTTGRSLHTAKAVLRHNHIFDNCPLPLPGVFMNGGASYLPGEVLCNSQTFSPSSLKSLLELTRAYPHAAFTFFALDTVFLVNANPFGRHISELHFLNAIEVNPAGVPGEIIKLMILDQNPAALSAIQKETEGWQIEGAYSLPYAFEINPLGINKANALPALLSALGLQGLPLYAAGDGENDLTLFRLANQCFAPETAHPAILENADHIIKRKEDGLLQPILAKIIK